MRKLVGPMHRKNGANGSIFVTSCLPELELDTSETLAFEASRQSECSYCGAEVVSRSQKFCFSCGARLA